MKFSRTLTWTLGLTVIALCATAAAHERKEVAGLDVVFGAEPEPALTGEKQFLRWRFLSKDKTPFGDIEEMSATVKRNGKTFGPFTGRMTAREPGVAPDGSTRLSWWWTVVSKRSATMPPRFAKRCSGPRARRVPT